ncbi:MAG: glutathione S-transferase family protein [Pseudomonadota bacterium]
MPPRPDIHLYHCPGTRSERVKLVLTRLDFPYRETLVDQSAGAQKSPDYLRINPFGKLPGLTLDGQPVVESAAQMLLLADLDPDARLAPRVDDPARAAYLQWMVAAPVTLEPMVLPMFSRVPLPGARRNFNRALAFQAALYQGPYLAGDRLTAADIFLHWGLRLVSRMGLLKHDKLWTDYTARLEEELNWAGLDHKTSALAST